MVRSSLLSLGLVLAVSVALPLPALANGGDFFEELSASWSAVAVPTTIINPASVPTATPSRR